MTRLLLLALALLPAAARAAPRDLVQASALDRELPRATGAARVQLLADAARVPWPVLTEAVEAEVATHLDALPADARRAYALDRALPLLAGELAAPDDLRAKILGELRRTAAAGTRPPLASVEAGRAAYARGDALTAAKTYAEVTRDSALWPEALRERAWALLVAVKPNEARLLKATVLLSHCRFEEAKAAIAPLEKEPAPTLSEEDARAAIDRNQAPSGEVGLRAWTAPLVVRVREALAGTRADDPTTPRRPALVALGARLLREAEAAEVEAERALTERALRLRYEAVRGERRQVEAGREATAALAQTPGLLDDDEIAWSFDGTFWRDELGTYRYVAADACGEKHP
jgi:hypothetical protein